MVSFELAAVTVISNMRMEMNGVFSFLFDCGLKILFYFQREEVCKIFTSCKSLSESICRYVKRKLAWNYTG